MRKKKHPIRLKKERVLLGDVLPYETPVIFSNRHFYDFVVENKITSDGKKIQYSGSDASITKVISWFNNGNTVPFSYKIAHKENDFRELAVMHPGNQLHVVDFYHKYQPLILYYNAKSSFSIRKPFKVSTLTTLQVERNLQVKEGEEEHEIIEEFGREYKNLKTYFVYRDYSNIHKFYESYRFHQAEKKYAKLVKFDISKCFDSIYTHSIAWALANKEIVKDKVDIVRDYSFGGAFDTLMQKLNYNETNGIVIGPEVSRIFAEIILQRIDFDVEQQLLIQHELRSKVEYEVYRYVDDYFLFCSSDKVQSQIIESFRIELKNYKLYLNESKTEVYDKPIITEITIAKSKISDLLDSSIKFKVEEVNSDKDKDVIEKKVKHSMYVSSNRVITRFKTILKETNVSYKNILNFTFSVIDRRLLSVLKKYTKLVDSFPKDRIKAEVCLVDSLLEVLDVCFFLYSVSPRVNTTLKLSTCVIKVVKFAKKNRYINSENKHRLFKKVFDEVSQVLGKQKGNKHAQIEYLFLLVILSELGRDYRLGTEVLCRYFSIKVESDNTFESSYDLNYWSIIILLFYTKNIKRYARLQEFVLENLVKKKFDAVKKEKRTQNTELVFLLLDLISCPFIQLEFKRKLLHLFGVKLKVDRDKIVKLRKYWFVKWTNFDLEKELSTKRSREVY